MLIVHLSVNMDDLQFEQLFGRGTFGSLHKGAWKKTSTDMDRSQVLENNK